MQVRHTQASTAQQATRAQQAFEQSAARMLAETTELKQLLAQSEDKREKGKAALVAAQTACVQLQGQLEQQRQRAADLVTQEQRREESSFYQAQARMDADATLAFNADLRDFARQFDIEPPPPSRSRAVSPLGRRVSPIRIRASPPRLVPRDLA